MNKKIIKIARKIVNALDDEFDPMQQKSLQEENKEFFLKNVINQNFPGFSKNYDNQTDTITYVFDNDEMESCYIIFWEENDMWNYSVYINDESVEDAENENCEKLFNKLVSSIHKYVEMFNNAVKERFEKMQEEEVEDESNGEIKISAVDENKLFRGDLQYLFYYFREDPDKTKDSKLYMVEFFPNISEQEYNANIRIIRENLPFFYKYFKNKKMLVQTNHSGDLKRLIDYFTAYGWEQK